MTMFIHYSFLLAGILDIQLSIITGGDSELTIEPCHLCTQLIIEALNNKPVRLRPFGRRSSGFWGSL